MLKFQIVNYMEFDNLIDRNKNAMIIDVRDEEDYNEGHIIHAYNIPYERIRYVYKKIPRDKILLIYCETGGTGIMAAKELYDEGYTTRALIGGIKGYRGKFI